MKNYLNFINLLEELKLVERANLVSGGRRRENSAEHSWHVSMMALLLGEKLSPEANLPRVIEMLLVHDIVEIKAGDTFFTDVDENTEKREREGLREILSLLPEETGRKLEDLWEEFQERATPESRLANALDGIQPILNYYFVGVPYMEHPELTIGDVVEKKQWIAEDFPNLWEVALDILEKSEKMGLYRKEVRD